MDESESNNGAPWWRHDMETLSALLAFSEGGIYPVNPQQRIAMRESVVSAVSPNKLLNKQVFFLTNACINSLWPKGYWLSKLCELKIYL